MKSKAPKVQVFVEAPELQIPRRALALTLDSNLTLCHLKSSLFPQIQAPDSAFFTSNGRSLPDATTLQNSRIAPMSTLTLRLRLRGGGGDGGATGAESRDCYLNMYAIKKPDKVDPNEQRLSKWLNCALSNEPLKHPVVVDMLGNLFNKEALVKALLSKKLPKAFGHIKGLKDMIGVHLSMIPGLELDENVNGQTQFQCPITGLEFNGKYRFFVLRSCGHVLSAKALKEVKSSACLVCHKEFSEADKIVINGNDEEVAALRKRMEKEKVQLKEKKAKKVKNGEAGVFPGDNVCLDSARLSGMKRGTDGKATDKALGKVKGNSKVAKDVAASGRVEVNGSSNGVAKRFKAADMAPANSTKEVYASIFTSSKKSDFKETYSCRSLPLGRN
ncbi:uncharacterized protein LOC127800333 [Diospyros lotus]|uniref:uncharacterized protein LOC127800333 n=1 Tax=Diospyros lotus TaxID=55363 RepID=UPI00224CEE01|nr:uncharacterized protein LOC127800333 [Diospyros lotus]